MKVYHKVNKKEMERKELLKTFTIKTMYVVSWCIQQTSLKNKIVTIDQKTMS